MDKVVIYNLDDLLKYLKVIVEKAIKYDQLNEIYHKYENMESTDIKAENLKELYEFLYKHIY